MSTFGGQQRGSEIVSIDQHGTYKTRRLTCVKTDSLATGNNNWRPISGSTRALLSGRGHKTRGSAHGLLTRALARADDAGEDVETAMHRQQHLWTPRRKKGGRRAEEILAKARRRDDASARATRERVLNRATMPLPVIAPLMTPAQAARSRRGS